MKTAEVQPVLRGAVKLLDHEFCFDSQDSHLSSVLYPTHSHIFFFLSLKIDEASCTLGILLSCLIVRVGNSAFDLVQLWVAHFLHLDARLCHEIRLNVIPHIIHLLMISGRLTHKSCIKNALSRGPFDFYSALPFKY